MLTDIPSFCEEKINSRLRNRFKSIGFAFQAFVSELLAKEYPKLRPVTVGGPDGAIDASCLTDHGKLVVESKHVSSEEYATAKQKWREIESKLLRNLASPKGPPRGQPQFGPWYRQDPPISQYIFCSNVCGNDNDRDELRIRIETFFRSTLAALGEHLRHLMGISVEVCDWDECCTRLRQHPYLIFRWFPDTRPNGLIPLDDHPPSEESFRNYLSENRLTYYSRGEHLLKCPAPDGIIIPTEEDLVARLSEGDRTGLVITGPGGVGKTRLALEVGRRARKEGWMVLHANALVCRASLDQLVDMLNHESRSLLVFDYIETQQNFAELTTYLYELNGIGYKIRYIANCRSSYYAQRTPESPHQRVSLSSQAGSVEQEWMDKYRRASVQSILELAYIPEGNILDECREIPVLAVFLLYLRESGRTEQLNALLQEENFENWVVKRIKASFPDISLGEIKKRLAAMLPLFPLPDETAGRFSRTEPFFNTVATDGWLEREEQGQVGRWRPMHPVVADRVLLSYLNDILPTRSFFLTELMEKAEEFGALGSVLISLQRISDYPPTNSIQWQALIAARIKANPDAWQTVREELLRSSLITLEETLQLLDDFPDFWAGIEQNLTVQIALGYFANQAWETGQPTPGSREHTILRKWTCLAAEHVIRAARTYETTSNFILKAGLRLLPGEVKPYALLWISNAPALFQTHYLLVAWCECHLPLSDITDSVRIWIFKFSDTLHLSYVVEAWLDAEGDPRVIRPVLNEWLNSLHGIQPYAQFAYSAWLKNVGEREFVRERLKKWLEVHHSIQGAGFVYRSWIKAEGDYAFIKPYAPRWLVTNWEDEGATYVIKCIIDDPYLPLAVVECIIKWCERFRDKEEAPKNLSKLTENDRFFEIGVRFLMAAKKVLTIQFSGGVTLTRFACDYITDLLYCLTRQADRHSSLYADQVDLLLLEWLKHPLSFGPNKPRKPIATQLSFTKRILSFIDDGRISLPEDRVSVEKFLQWVNKWNVDFKTELRDLLTSYAGKFRYPDLWQIVRFE